MKGTERHCRDVYVEMNVWSEKYEQNEHKIY